MATFAYLRVSTHDQSVKNQLQEIKQAGYHIDYTFADEGVSGANSAAQRPQFRELLAKIRDGETLVVSKLDRLGRDAHDIGATIKLLATRQIQVVVLQLGKLDLMSATGKMVLAVLAAMAEMERDLLIERTKAGLERAKAEGKTLGRPARLTPKDRKKVIELRDSGTSISALSRQFQVSRQTISRALEPNAAPASTPTKIAPPKAGKRAKKAVAGRSDEETDMERRVVLERQHGQLRLHP